MDFTTVAKLRKYLSVKHHIPGRIRITFDKSIMTDPEALALVKSAPAMPDAVTKTSLNIFSKSIVIEYDAKRVPPELLEELINAPSDDAASAVVEKLYSILYGA
ncbi:HMA2 domain-containing protein [Halodesulfovibrio spirochaetisodalis]|uniref:Heavy-metal-associated domain-containing protein n=1 Tax=Halodesulfovibrio spirochaetisodalis TaxID=1560234 RepID=A0A1B7XMY0_9BACT|nr:hypothetical protein [Halodesulfovibrio spirochaetisodalis]OBQ56866.1 hypothetical protein SP90_02075 [Halodesulfovibrio spirochaetisodalis]